MLKIFFISISSLLIFTIFTGKFFIFNCTNSRYMAQCGLVMAILFALYSINGIILAILPSSITYKIILIALGISPYIIGRLATYETLNVATFVQLTLLLGGIVYVIEN